jgi:hypothetical protein
MAMRKRNAATKGWAPRKKLPSSKRSSIVSYQRNDLLRLGMTAANQSMSIERRNMKKLTWEKFCILGGGEKLSREGRSYVVHPINVSTGHQALRTHTLPVFREHLNHLEWVPYTEFEMD